MLGRSFPFILYSVFFSPASSPAPSGEAKVTSFGQLNDGTDEERRLIKRTRERANVEEYSFHSYSSFQKSNKELHLWQVQVTFNAETDDAVCVCCVVLCCVVFCCAVLCCAVLCCVCGVVWCGVVWCVCVCVCVCVRCVVLC